MGPIEWNVTAYLGVSGEEQIRGGIEFALRQVDERMSTYKPDSEVSRFNETTSTDWFDISRETATVVARALEISQASDGAFDVTVAPLVKLWNFGPNKGDFALPKDEMIARVVESIGYRNLTVRLDPPSLRKDLPPLQIDLSAIAKGYAVDQVAQSLDEMAVDSYLVEVGGEVRARGFKSDGQPWTIGIERPVPNERTVLGTVELRDEALASSGDYRNFLEVNGRRYSHTIDPRTGHPVQQGPSAVSVIAGDCMTADAVATAVMVLGRTRGLELGRRLGLQVLVIEATGEGGRFATFGTEGFPLTRIENDPRRRESGAQSIFRMIAVASVFFALAILAMGVGLFFGRQRLRGSCGGIAALDDPDADPTCSICSVSGKECRELKKAIRQRHK